MEAPSHIICRLASRDSSAGPLACDAAGHPVHATPTVQTDAIPSPDEDAKALSPSKPRSQSIASKLADKIEGIASQVKSALPSSLSSSSSSASAAEPVVTSVHGIPVGDNTHSYNINGIVSAGDSFLFEQQQLFNRAKIVERAVHAAGSGAFGYFEVTNPEISRLTKASFLQTKGTKTPVFVRFSTVTYGREFPDSARNPRGMAVKFYTEEGNYDVLMVNFPVFFNRDPSLGPSVIRSQQRNPQNFQVNLDSTLDFMSLVPESCLANLWFWSDHGTPKGWQHFNAFPCHTFKWVNSQGQVTWVRYIFKTEQGVQNFDFDSAIRMCGEDPDYAKRDLWETINSGGTPAWRFCVQCMTEEDAQAAAINPFDCTKEWPEAQYPAKEVGRLVLDRNPENYHRDVEQSAFSPGRLVPGIELSPDPLLQFRATFYNDAQLYRLGTNYHQIPVNCPFRAAANYHPLSRDGSLRVDNNGGVEPHYYPNSFTNPPPAHPSLKANWSTGELHGTLARKAVPRSAEGTNTEYLQATIFYRDTLRPIERQHLHHNIARVFAKVSRPEVKLRYLLQAYQVHPEFCQGILDECERLGGANFNSAELNLDRVKKNIEQHPHTVDAANGYIPYPLV